MLGFFFVLGFCFFVLFLFLVFVVAVFTESAKTACVVACERETSAKAGC